MSQSPDEFARKLRRVADAAKPNSDRGIRARAYVTKRYIVAAAERQNRNARPSWVNYRIANGVAAIRLRGGMAHLTELGSHKHPQGWQETPRKAQALNTPAGPRASVQHPALRARPFWLAGVEASRAAGHRAYRDAALKSVSTIMR